MRVCELRRRQGRELGLRRAAAFRARREARARELGFPDLASYLRQRYTVDGVRVADLARELGAAVSAVVAEMDRAGIARQGGERIARAHAARRASRRSP